MCDIIAGASAALQITGNYLEQKSVAASTQAQMEAKKSAAIRSMNYMFQNYEKERQDAFDATVNNLDLLHRQARDLNEKVEAATNEQMAGRTARLINRNVKGDENRTASSLKDNYARKANEIDLNKEAALLSTKDYIAGVNTSAPKMPSAFANFVQSAGIILNAYTAAQNQRQKEKNFNNTGGANK